jgi:hypothetical protein
MMEESGKSNPACSPRSARIVDEKVIFMTESF